MSTWALSQDERMSAESDGTDRLGLQLGRGPGGEGGADDGMAGALPHVGVGVVEDHLHTVQNLA